MERGLKDILCEYCSQPVKKKGRRFCSNSCSARFRILNGGNNLGVTSLHEDTKVFCRNCQQLFTPASRLTNFCSISCSTKWQFKNNDTFINAHHVNRPNHTEQTKLKISASLKGHSVSEYLRRRMCGRGNPGYIDGASTKEYPILFNRTLRREIRGRDEYTCQLCGKHPEDFDEALYVHHINYNKDDISDLNLISLCHSCHSYTNFNRDLFKELFTEIMKIRFGGV
jgi:predicted restriction endonuclease